ncbi:WXG100 family type VII secretion target [Streptomyces sp. NPDC003077]|uniref:WXG100 family type VII secretion target n=1 Tax=Streptomyces sp. NPDC003077 TaxID=3154443 RepID=UPI0033AF9972
MTARRDPEALSGAAAAWHDMGEHMRELVRDLDRRVGTAAGDWHGPSGEAFTADWHRLKDAVEASLPVFTQTAAELESAADRSADQNGDGDEPARAADSSSGDAQGAGQQTAYGLMALGQMASSLGGVFGGRRGAGRGQGQRPPLRAQWPGSDAPQGPDPFGPPEAATRRGGAGVAKGVRTGEGTRTGEGARTRTGEETRTDEGESARKGEADTQPPPAPSALSAPPALPTTDSPAPPTTDSPAQATPDSLTEPPTGSLVEAQPTPDTPAPRNADRPDTPRHGAFG